MIRDRPPIPSDMMGISLRKENTRNNTSIHFFFSCPHCSKRKTLPIPGCQALHSLGCGPTKLSLTHWRSVQPRTLKIWDSRSKNIIRTGSGKQTARTSFSCFAVWEHPLKVCKILITRALTYLRCRSFFLLDTHGWYIYVFIVHANCGFHASHIPIGLCLYLNRPQCMDSFSKRQCTRTTWKSMQPHKLLSQIQTLKTSLISVHVLHYFLGACIPQP